MHRGGTKQKPPKYQTVQITVFLCEYLFFFREKRGDFGDNEDKIDTVLRGESNYRTLVDTPLSRAKCRVDHSKDRFLR